MGLAAKTTGRAAELEPAFILSCPANCRVFAPRLKPPVRGGYSATGSGRTYIAGAILRGHRRDGALGSVAIEPERAPDGSIGIWLDHATLAKLNHLSGPDGSYSDAIVTLRRRTRDGECRTRICAPPQL